VKREQLFLFPQRIALGCFSSTTRLARPGLLERSYVEDLDHKATEYAQIRKHKERSRTQRRLGQAQAIDNSEVDWGNGSGVS
jgi:hypothetical protein